MTLAAVLSIARTPVAVVAPAVVDAAAQSERSDSGLGTTTGVAGNNPSRRDAQYALN